MPLYSELTNGASVKVSKAFIRGQKMSLYFVRKTDKKGIRFQEVGIPIIELDMVDMDLIPEFEKRFDFEPEPIESFKPINAWKLRNQFKAAYKKDSFIGVKELAEKVKSQLDEHPTFHPMTRHMMESFIRMACMAEVYMKLADQMNYQSPKALSYELLRHHMNALFGCRKLDKISAPFHALGIPLIHQDVPHITPYPAGWGPEGKINA